MVDFVRTFYFPRGPQNITDITDFTDITNITDITDGLCNPHEKIDPPTYFSPPKSVRLAQDWKAPLVPKYLGIKFFRRSRMASDGPRAQV